MGGEDSSDTRRRPPQLDRLSEVTEGGEFPDRSSHDLPDGTPPASPRRVEWSDDDTPTCPTPYGATPGSSGALRATPRAPPSAASAAASPRTASPAVRPCRASSSSCSSGGEDYEESPPLFGAAGRSGTVEWGYAAAPCPSVLPHEHDYSLDDGGEGASEDTGGGVGAGGLTRGAAASDATDGAVDSSLLEEMERQIERQAARDARSRELTASLRASMASELAEPSAVRRKRRHAPSWCGWEGGAMCGGWPLGQVLAPVAVAVAVT